MSCDYRRGQIHRTVRSGSGSGSGDGIGFDHGSHHHATNNLNDPIVPPDGCASDTPVTVAPIHWSMLMSTLHSPTPSPLDLQETMYHVCCLVESHGWQHLPPPSDGDIVRLWQGMNRLIPAQWNTNTPVLGMYGSDQGIPGPVVVDLIRFLWFHASETRRQWLWRSIQKRADSERLESQGRYPSSAAMLALQWGIPVWQLEDGHQIIAQAVQHDPTTLDALGATLRYWDDTGDPEHRTRIRSDVSDALAQIVPDTPDTWRRWLAVVTHLIHTDPQVVESSPALIESVLRACTVDENGVSDAAMQVLAAMNDPFAHPTARSVVEQVAATSSSSRAYQRAADLLMQWTTDPETIRQIVETAWDTACDQTKDGKSRRRAVAVLRAAIQQDHAAPVIRPYLHRLVRDRSLPSVFVSLIAESFMDGKYSDLLVGDAIDIAQSLLTGDDSIRAITILSTIWHKGQGERVLRAVDTAMRRLSGLTDHSALSVPIAVLRPGVDDPRVGPQVVDMIRMIDPDRAAEEIIRALYTSPRPDPIPPGVVPAVVQACLAVPEAVTGKVLQTIWASDARAACTVTERMMESDDPAVRMRACEAIGAGWGTGNDDRIAKGIIRMLHDRYQTITSEFDRYTMLVLTDAVLDGIGKGENDRVRACWQACLAHSSPQMLGVVADRFHRHRHDDDLRERHHRDVWDTNTPGLVVSMLHDLYRRCIDTDTRAVASDATISILSTLARGWGRGVDADVYSLLHRITDDAIRTYTNHPTRRYRMDRTIAEIIRTMRFAWGSNSGADSPVTDHTIGDWLLAMTRWLDSVMDDQWMETEIGSAVVMAMTSGGGDPDRATMRRSRAFPTTVAKVRRDFARQHQADGSG